MKTIDIHAHWYPEEWIKLFEKDGAKEGASLERKDGKYHLKAKHITNAFDERFVVVDERIKEMDKRKVDVHALSLTTPMVYWASPGFGTALSQAFNDAASAAHKKHPCRLLGLAMLPMHSPSHALKELERASKLPGIRGLYQRQQRGIGREEVLGCLWQVRGARLDDLSSPGGHHRPGPDQEVLLEEPVRQSV
jgi:aminocarboxymuconate-semialdehyde decarboxylase